MPWGYLRNMIPPGVPAPIYIILVPVELLRFFVFLLETLVTLLQAFIFTTLTATYIASSLEASH